MNVVGIVCEYNPFHNGHLYQINETKRRIGEGCAVICVMSGNFVQRGDIAIFEKHVRAKAAVECGADIVIELPCPWSVNSAEKFAYGAVSLLENTGVCSHLAFGSETGDASVLERAAEKLRCGGMDEKIVYYLNKGISYAAARQKAMEETDKDCAEVLKNPNDILAVEYIKALKKLGSNMAPVAVKRSGAGHDESKIDGTFTSASHIRALIKDGENYEKFMPQRAAAIFAEKTEQGEGPVFIETCESGILYRLRTMTDEEYDALPENAEGLSNRIKKFGRTACSLEEILTGAKTKRYAMSRIRRMIIDAYLGLTAEDSSSAPPYISVLAFNEKGKAVLSDMKKSASLPIVIKPAAGKKLPENARRIYELSTGTDDIYALNYPDKRLRTGGRGWTKGPEIAEKSE